MFDDTKKSGTTVFLILFWVNRVSPRATAETNPSSIVGSKWAACSPKSFNAAACSILDSNSGPWLSYKRPVSSHLSALGYHFSYSHIE